MGSESREAKLEELPAHGNSEARTTSLARLLPAEQAVCYENKTLPCRNRIGAACFQADKVYE